MRKTKPKKKTAMVKNQVKEKNKEMERSDKEKTKTKETLEEGKLSKLETEGDRNKMKERRKKIKRGRCIKGYIKERKGRRE